MGGERGLDLRIESWFRAALAAVEPAAAVRRHLVRDGDALVVAGQRVPVGGRLAVVSVGKAAVAMARGAVEVLENLVQDVVIVTKAGAAGETALERWCVIGSSHPVPDQRSVEAGQAVLSLVRGLSAGDVLLALISGGGSALIEAPRPPVSLADLATATDLLLRAGAPIHDLNALRTPLSLIKGGGLRRAAGPAVVVTLVLSDVLGNDPRVIASGPTVVADLDPGSALAVLERYRLVDRMPRSVLDVLTRQPVAIGRESGADQRAVIDVVGDNARAVAALEIAARADGYRPLVVWSDRRGEAADLGAEWVEACLATPPEHDLLLGGGEATVTVRGDGVGGRNTEFALVAGLALEERGDDDWIVASLATDGQDGPTDAAGAIADASTPAKARAAGVDPVAALARNDSLRVFAGAGGLVSPGPTGTNVNDLYLAVRRRRPGSVAGSRNGSRD